MSQLALSRGVGVYRASEAHVLVVDRMWKPNGTRRGIVFCHGAAHTADTDVVAGQAQADKVFALAAAGYPVLCADLSSSTYSGSNWGNADHVSAVAAAVAFLAGAAGAKTDKVGLYCGSMGTLGLNWARSNLGSVFAAALSIPVLDLDDVYQGDKGGLRASIATAYGISYPTAIPSLATRSPAAYGASDLAGLPVKLWCASDDPIASNVTAAGAWSGKGATVAGVVSLGAVGHDATTVDSQQVVAFFDANGGRA